MLHRLTKPDGTIDEPALFEAFVSAVRHTIRSCPGFTVAGLMASNWKRLLDEAKGEQSAYAFSRGRGPTMPFTSGALFGGKFSPVDPVEARRARLLRFVKRIGDSDPTATFDLRLGRAKLRWGWLTDEALEDITADMVRDFWARKRLTRENREGRARWAAEQRARLSAAE